VVRIGGVVARLNPTCKGTELALIYAHLLDQPGLLDEVPNKERKAVARRCIRVAEYVKSPVVVSILQCATLTCDVFSWSKYSLAVCCNIQSLEQFLQVPRY